MYRVSGIALVCLISSVQLAVADEPAHHAPSARPAQWANRQLDGSYRNGWLPPYAAAPAWRRNGYDWRYRATRPYVPTYRYRSYAAPYAYPRWQRPRMSPYGINGWRYRYRDA
jgi:hypothetical protein